MVDDNVDTVTMLAMLVRESGYDVRTAFDGSTVLEIALDYRPNVILLDIGLPGLNGYQVAKQIRQQPALKDTVLVAMTGYGQESDRQNSQQAGFDHHLVKPAEFAIGAANTGESLGLASLMDTSGEMEKAVCQGIRCFEMEARGRAPKEIHAHLIGTLLVVRLQGVLTAAEQQLAKSPPYGKGRDLLKQLRTHLIETAKPLLQVMVEGITGVKMMSLHHDISSVTGESIIVFTLAEAPFGKSKKK